MVELDPRTRPTVRQEMLVVAATLALGTLAGFVTTSAYESRYAATVVPLMLLAVAAGFLVTPRRWPVFVLFALWAALALVGIGRNVFESRSQAEELAESIDRQARPGDLVVTCPDQLAPAVERALHQARTEVQVLGYPALGDGRFVDWRDYEGRNAAAAPAVVAAEVINHAAGANVWLVEQHGLPDPRGRLRGIGGRIGLRAPRCGRRGSCRLFRVGVAAAVQGTGGGPWHIWHRFSARRAQRRGLVLVVAVSVLPVVVAFVRATISGWVPLGDNAYFTVRLRDVLTEHHPLLGAWSSGSANTGELVNSLGPLQLDLLAIPVRIDADVGTALGVSLINAAALVLAIWFGHRRGRACRGRCSSGSRVPCCAGPWAGRSSSSRSRTSLSCCRSSPS